MWRGGLVLLLSVFAACDSAPGALPPAPGDAEARPGGLGHRDSVRYVVHVSVDGLRPDAVETLGPDLAPAFARLRREGASTHNARTDPDVRYTLPNHVTQLTGRTALGEGGHRWLDNTGDAAGTVHDRHGSYLPSVFDVVRGHGLRTAAYVSKEKLYLLDRSYGADGPAVIGRFDHHPDTGLLVSRAVRDLEAGPAHYTFLHLRDPDAAGHGHGWSLEPGSPYLEAVQAADARIGALLSFVEGDARFRGRTALVVTSDHGGRKREHGTGHRDHITVPLYVWGPGVRPADLYALNPQRRDPGAGQGDAPIRNGDAANLSLSLLGLEAVPGSALSGLEVGR